MNETGKTTLNCAEAVPTQIDALRAAGKLTVADEARFCELDAAMMKRGNAGVRRIMGPVIEAQVRHYEAAKARG